MLKIENITNFNLVDTITCGQIFRYEKELDDSWTIILIDRVINVKYINNTLIIDSNNYDNLEEVVRKYFDLDRNYEMIDKEILKTDNSLKEIVKYCKGLKMINSYPLETTISYIISANNSVSSIKKSVDKISMLYGNKINFKNKDYYLFPTLEQLKDVSVSDFRSCSVGFRDKYIKSFINMLEKDNMFLEKINNLNSNEAFEILLKQPGIGPKVASCILLFAYQKFDVFPVDTWVKKIMKEKYKITGEKNIREYTKKKYNEYCGIVIQYMFHYRRNSGQK